MSMTIEACPGTAAIAQPSRSGPSATSSRAASGQQRIALVDLLDRVLAGGVVVAGDVTLSIADVDMVTISLRALISSVRSGVLRPPDARKAVGR